MKLLSGYNTIVKLASVTTGITISEFDFPDFGSQIGFKVREVFIDPDPTVHPASLAAGAYALQCGLVDDYYTPSTTFLNNSGVIAYIARQKLATGVGNALSFEGGSVKIDDMEVTLKLSALSKSVNITTPIVVAYQVIYDAYQLSQTEYLEALSKVS